MDRPALLQTHRRFCHHQLKRPPPIADTHLRRVSQVKILLVDDSLFILHENHRVLERAGHEVICAEDGESALRLVDEFPVDIILLDLLLPKIGGLEVLQRLKKNPATAEIPVVILSSLSEKNRDKLIAAGAEEYFEKSILMPRRDQNLLPKLLEDVAQRIKTRRTQDPGKSNRHTAPSAKRATLQHT
jgi:CheY-like chemotaxis protein